MQDCVEGMATVQQAVIAICEQAMLTVIELPRQMDKGARGERRLLPSWQTVHGGG